MSGTAVVTRVSPEEQARTFGVEHFRRATEKGITVSQLLERDDPTESGDRSGLDAFERVVKASGLILNPVDECGIRASTWQEATSTQERRALINEWAARVWRQAARMPSAPNTAAMQRAVLLSGDAAVNTLLKPYTDDDTPRAKRLVPPIPLEALIARTTPIEGQDYRSLYITDDLGTDAYRLKRVVEGADIPSTVLVTGEHTLQIHKFGRALRATYEQLRRQRLDRIAYILARMALQAEVDKATDALNTIVSGDGNANTAATVLALTSLDSGASAGTLTLKGYLTFISRFTNVYNPDVLLGQEASIMQLLLLAVNTVNGIPLVMFKGEFGSLRNIGARFPGGIGYGITSDAPSLKLVTFDSSAALERVVEIGGNVSEVERFIHNQTQMLTLTEVTGFGVLDPNASKILNING